MKKIIDTIEKKLNVEVIHVFEIKQDGKEIIANLKLSENEGLKVLLKEMKNQYGTCYKVISASNYEIKKEEKKKKFRTKTENLCGKQRNKIVEYAKKVIKELEEGTAVFKEIEGPTKGDEYIRFMLISTIDGKSVKADISVEELREEA